MLDLTFIRENQERVREALKTRAPKLDFDAFLRLDADRRQILQESDALKAERNKANDEISLLLKEKKDAKGKIEGMKSISQKIKDLDVKVGEVEGKVRETL